jgi:hypothetical protein
MPRPKLSTPERRRRRNQSQARWRSSVTTISSSSQLGSQQQADHQRVAHHPFILTSIPTLDPSQGVAEEDNTARGGRHQEEEGLANDSQVHLLEGEGEFQDSGFQDTSNLEPSPERLGAFLRRSRSQMRSQSPSKRSRTTSELAAHLEQGRSEDAEDVENTKDVEDVVEIRNDSGQ